MNNQDMDGKTVVITGASDGIGRSTATGLVRMGAKVLIVGRNETKTRQVAEAMEKARAGASVHPFIADLSQMDEVRRVSEEILSAHPVIDVLVNNVGGIFMDRRLSADGLEMTFALNHLSHYLLTHLFLDSLMAAPEGRIVNVSSGAHRGVSLDFDDLQMEGKFEGWKAYQRSKLCNLYFTFALARRMRETGVTVNALHPGFVASKIGNNNEGKMFSMALGFAKRIAAVSPATGARTSIYLASSPEVHGVTGDYFEKCQVAKASATARQADAAERLWAVSRSMTGAG